MAVVSQKGNCYLCGATLTKAAFKKHALSAHCAMDENAQNCVVLKVEGKYDKSYWLYLDISATSTLETLDNFLRDIWLECCGHMSAFFFSDFEEVSKSRKMKEFSEGMKFDYQYDFGSTTELVITVMGVSRRTKQRKAVRLLGRNEPFLYSCDKCGKPADNICTECACEDENPFYCDGCMSEHEHADMFLPVTNSPRMGECAYCGDQDNYQFDSSLFADAKK